MESLGHTSGHNNKEGLLASGSIEGHDDEGSGSVCFSLVSEHIKKCWDDLLEFAGKVWKMGRSDPRKVLFAIKMGLALSMVSLLIFWKESYNNISQYTIWAILTVIVMFEFSIGATFIKGFNRGLGTLCAGVLAFCFAELSLLAGQWEEVVIVISIFITGFFASYLKLYPTMKPYEYGFRVFTLTYCILMVAGNRTREYSEAIVIRLVLIAVGAAVCLVVNTCIYPIWSGEDLHNLVVQNFKCVAASLEGCVNGYLKCVEYKRVPSTVLTCQPAEEPLCMSYLSVVESSRQEDTLLGFAIWEPPHGRYKMFNYPWKDYIIVSGALRHCAFTLMALHGCIQSEIQAPAERRQVFRSELQKVGAEGAKVLRQLGSKVEKMEKLGPGDILKEVHEAAEQLQKKIDHRSYLLVNSESWEIGRQPEALEDLEKLLDEDSERTRFASKSLSESVLDFSSLPAWTPKNGCSTYISQKQKSWPLRLPLNGDVDVTEGECRTYESASALSLATFASLLIEFVARLQNVVDTFEELSEKADFEEPSVSVPTPAKRVGFWVRIFGYYTLK